MRARWVLFLILASIIIISGCGGELSAKDGDTVSVHYTLRLADGTVIQTSVGSDPYQFTIGSSGTISGFSQAVIGMKPGESKTVEIPADEAYGPYDEDLVYVVNRDDLPSDLELEVGQWYQAYSFTVIELSESTVTLDYNHPLAGKDLTFDIELVEIL